MTQQGFTDLWHLWQGRLKKRVYIESGLHTLTLTLVSVSVSVKDMVLWPSRIRVATCHAATGCHKAPGACLALTGMP